MNRSLHCRPAQLNRQLAVTLATAAALVVGSGILYGRYSQRWGPPPDLVKAGQHLETMPTQIGEWRLADESEMKKSVQQMLECAGYTNRRYVHQESGATVSISIIVGPPGPTAVHTPEICFSSRRHELAGERRRVHIDGPGAGEHEFWFVDFRARDPLADGLRVYYAWSRGQWWEASKSPRYEFAAGTLLYKLQLATPRDPDADDEAPDAGNEFLQALAESNWQLQPES